jgi:hypothetical protein
MAKGLKAGEVVPDLAWADRLVDSPGDRNAATGVRGKHVPVLHACWNRPRYSHMTSPKESVLGIVVSSGICLVKPHPAAMVISVICAARYRGANPSS